MSGAGIADRVAAAFIRAGNATGTGPYICTLKRAGVAALSPKEAENNGDGAPTFHEITAIQGSQKQRDANGTLIGETRTTLMVDATGVKPLKSDVVALGVALADIDADTKYHEIDDVETTAPAGVPILYEVILAL